MEEPARHLLFHGVIIFLLGLFAGIPYARAILKRKSESLIFAWRVAHSALCIGAILMFSLVPIVPLLSVDDKTVWTIAVLFIVSGYSFAAALYIGPHVGSRGLSFKGSISKKLVYLCNISGAVTSTIGALVLLYGAWKSL